MATAGSQNAIFFPPSHFFFFFPHWPVARKTGEELWEDENREERIEKESKGGQQEDGRHQCFWQQLTMAQALWHTPGVSQPSKQGQVPSNLSTLVSPTPSDFIDPTLQTTLCSICPMAHTQFTCKTLISHSSHQHLGLTLKELQSDTEEDRARSSTVEWSTLM